MAGLAALVLGGSGQVGRALVRSLAPHARVVAPARADVDLARLDSLRSVIRAEKPDVVLNAAAYTAVDAAESDAARCMALNGDAPAAIAKECRTIDALRIHFSSDYVFDGTKRRPYLETDEPNPLSV